MITAMQEANTQGSAKAMHKAVADQSKARQALARIQAQRATYLQAWHTYLGQLAQLLEKQLAEQTQVLENFDNSELQWTQADQQATQQLARLAGADKETAEPNDKDMEDAEALVDSAMETEQRLKAATAESQQSARRMLTALGEMKQNAEELAQRQGGEGSRTPRRGQQSENGSKEAAKDEKGTEACPLARPIHRPPGYVWAVYAPRKS